MAEDPSGRCLANPEICPRCGQPFVNDAGICLTCRYGAAQSPSETVRDRCEVVAKALYEHAGANRFFGPWATLVTRREHHLAAVADMYRDQAAVAYRALIAHTAATATETVD